jgi:two-component system, chemotaxis family, protein-glutamate methylesterase/glutaminase
MIRILIVDDVRAVREKLVYEFTQVPDLEVVGVARNGRMGIEMALSKKPDLVLMDLTMPDMDGFAATRAIMEQQPMPVVVLSAQNASAVSQQAFDSGAVEFVSKDTPIPKLIEIIRNMSHVRVVGFHVRQRAPAVRRRPSSVVPVGHPPEPKSPRGIVLIGASTGGPQALQLLFSSLAPGLPLAFAVVQHIAQGFLGSLVEWLAMTSIPKVRIAEQGQRMDAGNVYLAPDDAHLHLVKNGYLALSNSPVRNGVRPSADELFESAAKWERRKRFGLLLTGMGSDGAQGLLALRAAGAMTLTQDEKSCIVYGMPAVAVAMGASQGSADPVGAAAAIGAWANSLEKPAP